MGIGDGVYSVVYQILEHYYNNFAAYLPKLSAGIAIIVLGYFVSWFVGFFVRSALYKFNLDKRFRKPDLDDSFGKISLAKLFGILTKWFLFFVFFARGVVLLEIGLLNTLANYIADWTLFLTINIILTVLGFVLIDFALYKVWEIRTKYDKAIRLSARALLVIVIALTALEQRDINLFFVRVIFLLVLTAVVLSASIAVGIGLGIALSKSFGEIIAESKFFKKKKRR